MRKSKKVPRPAAPPSFDDPLVAAAFNEWLRRYIENPAAFEAEFNAISVFRAECGSNRPPSYGQVCSVYLERILVELRQAIGKVA